MSNCNNCRRPINSCSCTINVRNTTINSDQAGRDGLSAYQIAVLTGKTTATSEAQWVDEIQGAREGKDGDVYIPINEDSYFDV